VVGAAADEVAAADAVPLEPAFGLLELEQATAPRARTLTIATPVRDLRSIGTSPNRSASLADNRFDRIFGAGGITASVVQGGTAA
jgi:hypothetical protein